MRGGTDGSVVHWPTVRQESERRYCRRTGIRHHVDTERSRGWRGEGRRSRSRGQYRVADEASTFADWRDDDWQDPDDADASSLAETTREGDAARAEIAEATWDAEARHEADDDGLTTEES